MSTKHQPSIVNLESFDDIKKKSLFSSANKILSLSNSQFYNPYFELVNNSCTETYDQSNINANLCLSSKYKVVNIEFIINSDDEYEDVNDEEEDEDEGAQSHSHDCYEEKLTISEEDINNLPEESREIIKEVQHQDHLQCKMRVSTDDDKIFNCFPIMASIEKIDPKSNTVKTYKQKLFCKRSPLLEPLKIILDEHVKITPNTDISRINEELINTTANKINSIHNSSHVEAFGLYCLSRLTETGLCPTFPYYFGCLNGISNIFYHNITAEMPELYTKKWFIDKSHRGDIEIIYIDLDTLTKSNNSSHSSLDIDEILKKSLEGKEVDDVSDISSMDEEELTNLTDIVKKRFEELDMDDIKPETITDENVEPCIDEIIESDITIDSKTIDEEQMPKKLMPKIVYPETDEYNFDGFEIDVQMGGTNDIIDSDLEEELNMDNIVNMRDFLHNKVFFAKFQDMPVNYCFMERLGETFDELLTSNDNISEDELLSILFQVTFGLAIANKKYSFVHNDLHSDNILFQSTKRSYIYYGIKDNKSKETTTKTVKKYKYYRIPTFGKITKIIDFARATFKINNKWIFSDVFLPTGEAAGQYKFPDCDESVYWGSGFMGADEPNPSFDLARLARSIEHHIRNSTIYNLIKKWSKSDDGSNMLDKEDDFNLYIDIAKNCHNAVPKHVLHDKVFKRFEINKSHIPKGEHVYIL